MSTAMLIAVMGALTAGAPENGLFFEVLPTVSDNGYALVQLRPVCRWLNANVEVDGSTIRITKAPTIRLGLEVGSTRAKIADSDFVLPAPPILVRGNVMIPLRFVAEGFGAWVDFSGRQIRLSLLQESQVIVMATPPHPQSHIGKMYAVLSRYLGLIPPPAGEPASLYYFNTLSRRYKEQLTAGGATPEAVEQSLRQRRIPAARVERDNYDGALQGWLDVALLDRAGNVTHQRVMFVKEADGWKVDDLRPL